MPTDPIQKNKGAFLAILATTFFLASLYFLVVYLFVGVGEVNKFLFMWAVIGLPVALNGVHNVSSGRTPETQDTALRDFRGVLLIPYYIPMSIAVAIFMISEDVEDSDLTQHGKELAKPFLIAITVWLAILGAPMLHLV